AADDRPLYVGKSGAIATRVKSYFTAAEKRARISEMLAAAQRVEAIECAHGLEAEIRELRLIAAHKPPYNRRSKFPERHHWLERIAGYAGRGRYEEAAVVRSRLAALLRATIRMQRLHSLTTIAELVAARPAAKGGWELAVVRHGRLVAAGVSPPGTHPRPVIEVLLASAETVRPGPGPTPCASAEETERVLAWLE